MSFVGQDFVGDTRCAGLIADLAASVVYVPSEVLKTRLQLQGRYNNPYFSSGYNYRGTADAVRTIIRREGVSALFYGYKATLYRDLPFSALQFMFYEQFRTWALLYKYGPGATAATTVGSHGEYLGTPLELATGAAAGGLAGTITCPLDVVKTRLQTQLHPEAVTGAAAKSSSSSMSTSSVAAATRPAQSHPQPPLAPSSPQQQHQQQPQQQHQQQPQQRRPISTSSPSTHTPARGAPSLETSSVYTGLKVIYRTEGFGGWFRGVGPRFAWTSVQSGCMLFLYQAILRRLAVVWPLRDAVDERRLASV